MIIRHNGGIVSVQTPEAGSANHELGNSAEMADPVFKQSLATQGNVRIDARGPVGGEITRHKSDGDKHQGDPGKDQRVARSRRGY